MAIDLAAGRIVFDGAPDALTVRTLSAIYGESEEAIDERMTSLSFQAAGQHVLARA